jgi:hypothetical protein
MDKVIGITFKENDVETTMRGFAPWYKEQLTRLKSVK